MYLTTRGFLMKKYISAVIAMIIVICSSLTAYADNSNSVIEINYGNISSENNETEYGLSLDDSVFSIDESLSANLVENGSFENKDAGWLFSGVNCTYSNTDSISKLNPTYDIVAVEESCIIKNTGYSEEGGMSFVKSEKYKFSLYLKNIDFKGVIRVWLASDKNSTEIVQLSTQGLSKKAWSQFGATLAAKGTELGCLAIQFEGTGSIAVDDVCLIPESSYGFDNSAWKNACIRADLFSAIQSLNPDFIRFSLNTSWKNTIGSQSDREHSDSSNYIGYHEYLQLCSDVKAEAIPCISVDGLKPNTDEFSNFNQDVLDMIEYANADSTTSYYGALRAGNGSTEPFGLKKIQIIGDGEAFNRIKSAINKKHENITVLNKDDISIVKNEADNTVCEMLNNAKGMIEGKMVMFNTPFSSNETPCLVEYSSSDIAYMPTYYAQMILSNNNSGRQIPSSSISEDVIQKVSVDENSQIIYVQLINNGSSRKISLSINGFDSINNASIQSVGDGYLSAYNKIGRQYVAPTEKAIEAEGNIISVKLPANSVNAIRIAYGNNNGDAVYKLPENIDYKAKNYVPPAIIVFLVVLCLSIPIGSFIGFYIYKNIISKGKKEKND